MLSRLAAAALILSLFPGAARAYVLNEYFDQEYLDTCLGGEGAVDPPGGVELGCDDAGILMMLIADTKRVAAEELKAPPSSLDEYYAPRLRRPTVERDMHPYRRWHNATSEDEAAIRKAESACRLGRTHPDCAKAHAAVLDHAYAACARDLPKCEMLQETALFAAGAGAGTALRFGGSITLRLFGGRASPVAMTRLERVVRAGRGRSELGAVLEHEIPKLAKGGGELLWKGAKSSMSGDVFRTRDTLRISIRTLKVDNTLMYGVRPKGLNIEFARIVSSMVRSSAECARAEPAIRTVVLEGRGIVNLPLIELMKRSGGRAVHQSNVSVSFDAAELTALMARLRP